jgi:hypothetical protein
MPGEHAGVGCEVATWRRMKLTAITDVLTATARRTFHVRFKAPLSAAARRFESLDEGLRPPVQLADPLPCLEPPKASDRTACVRAAEPAERSRIASKPASGVYIDK